MKKMKKVVPKRKALLFIVVAILVIVIGAAIWLAVSYGAKSREQPQPILNEPAAIEERRSDDQTSEAASATETKKQNIESGTTTAPSDSFTTTISATTEDKDAGVLRVRALISAILASGTCQLVLTGSNGGSRAYSVDVQAGPSNSTCKGFDIPLGDLSAGTWSIVLTVESNGTAAKANSEVTIGG